MSTALNAIKQNQYPFQFKKLNYNLKRFYYYSLLYNVYCILSIPPSPPCGLLNVSTAAVKITDKNALVKKRHNNKQGN